MSESDSGEDADRSLNRISKQADSIIDEGTDWPELARELDGTHYASQDPYPDWHAGTEFEPMFLAILWAKTENESVTGVDDRLAENSEIAEAMGFDASDLPHGDTFARAWRNRFADLQTSIEVAARHIDEMATERGSPIGATGINPVETDGTSSRHETRLLRKKTREVLEHMSDVVYPALDIPRPEGAIYDEDDLLELLTVMGIEGSAANEGTDLNSDRLFDERDPDEDDPFYVDGPKDGETVLNPLHELEIDEITEMVNDGCARTINRLKPYVEFTRPVFLAIDITYIAYYGDRDELKWATGAPDFKEYSYCYKVATATIVGDNTHLVAGMVPLGKAEAHDDSGYSGDEEKTYRVGKVVRDLMDIVSNHVSVDCVYADREFAAADTIIALEAHNVYYVIPAPRNIRSKRWLRHNVDTERGIIATKEDWAVYGSVEGKSSNERVTTTLVGMPGDPDERQYGYGRADEDELAGDDEGDLPAAVPFYTNKDLKDETALDRRITKNEIEKYNRRGGIETSFEKISQFASYTTSWDFSVRLFEVGFAVLLYNMWLVVDFLVQVGLDVEIRSKPRITARRFIRFVDRNLSKLI